MYTTSSVSKRLFLVSILAVVTTQLILIHSVSSLNTTNAYLQHKCLVSQGKYKPGSQHEKYLNRIIRGFSGDMIGFRTGFGIMSFGSAPDLVAVNFQCRGDSYGPKCSSCFETAQSELRKRCPRDKGAIIWYDQCLVEFSSVDTVGHINYDDGFCMSSAKNLTGDSVSFETELLTLLDNLTTIAITKKDKNQKGVDKPMLYGAGEKMLLKMQTYAMMQCTIDLSRKACLECMSHLIVDYQNCYRDKRGARVLGRSCNFRFELYPFVNAKTSPNYIKY